MRARTGTCAICGWPVYDYGNSAAPWDGRACHDCDNRFVSPARIYGVSDPAILALLTKFASLGRTLATATAAAREHYRIDEQKRRKEDAANDDR